MHEFRCALFTIILSIFYIVNAWHSPSISNFTITNERTTAGYFPRAGVVTNSDICTDIGLEILNEDGSATDAAIAALLCEGIANPQSMGIGGGFIMTVFEASTRTVEVLNAREIAPEAATSDMFQTSTKRFSDISSGGLAVAVPGEVKGYWEAHQRFGRMGWHDLFAPAIDVATTGVPITKYIADMIAKMHEDIYESPTIKEFLTNPATGGYYVEGDIMKRPLLAGTLDKIANFGPDVLYNGPLTDDLIFDITREGGIMTMADMAAYKAIWNKPIEHSIGDYMFYTSGAPGSGELLMHVLDVMSAKICNKDRRFWHHLIETWKYVFALRSDMSGGDANSNRSPQVNDSVAQRITQLIRNDCTSNNIDDYLSRVSRRPLVEDHGTSHICVYAANGDAVSVTSTINLSFGAMFVSQSTGIVLNNEMVDFAIPGILGLNDNGPNKILPFHYPMSTMMPTIVYDRAVEQIRLIIGGSGGFKILTATSVVILEHLFMDLPLDVAISSKRLHHQLTPMIVEYEEGFPEDILKYLQKAGHTLQSLDGFSQINCTDLMPMYSGVNAIAIIGNQIHPVGDPRRQGCGDGL